MHFDDGVLHDLIGQAQRLVEVVQRDGIDRDQREKEQDGPGP